VFNTMAASLEEHARELERRVEERTTALTKANELLALLATTDELTGVKNHRSFQESLRVEWRRSQRSGAPLSLLMIDVDYFKRFNDTHGHPAGDALLRDLARCLREHLRETDRVARYGGEEFAVLLLDTNQKTARHVAEKLRAAVEATHFAHAESPATERVTISLGVASYPTDAGEPKALVEAADQALYRAKRAGRNRVCTASEEGEP
jgi:diguanylate cyclase (GGDEF)-like protein